MPLNYIPLAARRLAGLPIQPLAPPPQLARAGPVSADRRGHPPALRPRHNPADAFLSAPAARTTKLLTDLRRAACTTRGTDVLAQRAALRAHLGGLGVSTLAREMRDASTRRKFTPNRRSGMSQYALCMETKRSSCFPITRDKVTAYLTWALLEKGTVQSHTLGKVLGNLRGAARLMNKWPLTRRDEDDLEGQIKLLQQSQPSSAKITMPIPTSDLIATATRLQSLGTLQSKQVLGLLCVGMGVLARGKEMGSKEGMRWVDMATDHRGLGFNAVHGKLSNGSSAPRPRAFPHLPPHLAVLCPSRALISYRAALEAAGGRPKPTDSVWVEVSSSGVPTDRTLSVTQTTAMVKSELAADGADVSSFGDHWGRYAGNNVLSYDLRMHASADMLGDWAPPRSTGSRTNVRTKIYSHPTLDKQMTLADEEARFIHSASGLCCQL